MVIHFRRGSWVLGYTALHYFSSVSFSSCSYDLQSPVASSQAYNKWFKSLFLESVFELGDLMVCYKANVSCVVMNTTASRGCHQGFILMWLCSANGITTWNHILALPHVEYYCSGTVGEGMESGDETTGNHCNDLQTINSSFPNGISFLKQKQCTLSNRELEEAF